MDLIDRQYLSTPFYGSRRMKVWLGRQGYLVNRKRVQRLMRIMGLQAIYRRPRTSRPEPRHKVYPYLLGAMDPDSIGTGRIRCGRRISLTYPWPRVSCTWSPSWIGTAGHVVAWRLSNTLDADFCVEALEEALSKGQPEVFNTDQGSQFTSEGFTGLLKQRGIRISPDEYGTFGMDGKGRYKANIFVERLWRTVKYEEVYLKAYTDGMQANIGLKSYFHFYNNQRPHQALGYRTPAEVIDCESPAPNDQSAERRRPSIKPAEHPGKPAGFSPNVPLNLSS